MLNQCNFIGNLSADPEIKQTNTGKTVCNFRLGVSEKRGGEEHTEWVLVICWEKTAEFVGNYMRKGNRAFVSGRMCTRQWNDKDGNKRYTTEIIANQVQNLSPKSDDRPAKQNTDQYQGTGSDCPF